MRTHQHAQKILLNQKIAGRTQVSYGGDGAPAVAANQSAMCAQAAAGSPYPVPARFALLFGKAAS